MYVTLIPEQLYVNIKNHTDMLPWQYIYNITKWYENGSNYVTKPMLTEFVDVQMRHLVRVRTILPTAYFAIEGRVFFAEAMLGENELEQVGLLLGIQFLFLKTFDFY